jgi:hypothetical protein
MDSFFRPPENNVPFTDAEDIHTLSQQPLQAPAFGPAALQHLVPSISIVPFAA